MNSRITLSLTNLDFCVLLTVAADVSRGGLRIQEIPIQYASSQEDDTTYDDISLVIYGIDQHNYLHSPLALTDYLHPHPLTILQT